MEGSDVDGLFKCVALCEGRLDETLQPLLVREGVHRMLRGYSWQLERFSIRIVLGAGLGLRV